MPLVLIIDDREDNVTLFKEALGSYLPECVCKTANSGEAGLAQVDALIDDLDLIVLDASMPGLDGFTVCETLKASRKTAHIPIMMLSAVFVDAEDRIRGMNCGADSYLSKPYHIEELVAQIRVLLRVKQNEDRLREHERSLQEQLEQRTGELVQSEQRFRTLFEQSPIAILVLDSQNLILDCNPGAQHLLSLEGDVQMTHFTSFLAAEDKTIFDKAKSTGATHTPKEITCLKPDGKQIAVEFHCIDIQYNDAPAILLQLQDISERKALEAQIRSSQKMDAMGRLAGGLAHDFNNMLTSILGYSQLLKENSKDPDVIEDLTQIIHSADRASNLTRQLMMISNRQVTPKHPLQLNDIVKQVDPVLRRTIGKHIELVTLLAEDLPLIRSDEGLMEQILLNLVINARDAMPDSGRLVIATTAIPLDENFLKPWPSQQPGEYVRLSIQDTGCGIADEISDRIFEPFFSTKSREKGRGLGLSTVYGIVKNAEGFIDMKSDEKGTTFNIYLPVHHLKEEFESFEDTSPSLPTGIEHILLVDDESLILELSKRILTDLGYSVVAHTNGADAIRSFNESEIPFDLLITDVIMPQMGGPALAKRLRTSLPELKILFVTGFTDNTLSAQDIDHKFSNLLLKPFTKADLARKARNLLDL